MTPVRSRWSWELRVLGALLLAACAPELDVGPQVDALLVDVPCAQEVQTSMEQWGAGRDFIEGPPTASGARTFRFPTHAFAEWVVLTVPPQAPPSVVHMTAEGASAHVFAADCSAAQRRRPHQAVSTDTAAVFTDAHLRTHIDAADQGVVVYVWAPHMPLSTDGYAEVREAGEALGLRVVPVLMAFSDRAFAAREANRAGIPPEGLRWIDSNELVQRQAQVHAPSIVIFGRDRISPVLPGYRSADGYRRYLEAFLQGSS